MNERELKPCSCKPNQICSDRPFCDAEDKPHWNTRTPSEPVAYCKCPKCEHEIPMPHQSIRTMALRSGLVAPEWVEEAAKEIARQWTYISCNHAEPAIKNILAVKLEEAKTLHPAPSEPVAWLVLSQKGEFIMAVENMDEAVREACQMGASVVVSPAYTTPPDTEARRLLKEIRNVACGKTQVAFDDTEGMKWIFEKIESHLAQTDAEGE